MRLAALGRPLFKYTPAMQRPAVAAATALLAIASYGSVKDATSSELLLQYLAGLLHGILAVCCALLYFRTSSSSTVAMESSAKGASTMEQTSPPAQVTGVPAPSTEAPPSSVLAPAAAPPAQEFTIDEYESIRKQRREPMSSRRTPRTPVRYGWDK